MGFHLKTQAFGTKNKEFNFNLWREEDFIHPVPMFGVSTGTMQRF